MVSAWTSLSRQLGAWLIALAIVLQGLAPAGVMVAKTDKGAQLVICTGHGPAALKVGPAAPVSRTGGKTRSEGVCAFAGHGAAAAGTVQPMLFSQGVAYAQAPPDVRAEPLLITAGPPAPPPPSRGPPILTA